MANSPNNSNRLYDGARNFFNGVNSSLAPDNLPEGFISWAVNGVNRGGYWYTRPGYQSRVRLPDGRAQGLTLFTPTSGTTYLVAAVNGKIYASSYPFSTYSQIPNIQFNPYVDHVIFKEAVQGVESGVLREPRAVLLMQDGLTKPAFWDGSTSRHLNPGFPQKETVLGLQMEWIGSRLWVARGNQIFASDIYDPLHFIETEYLSIGGSLQTLDGKPVTMLARTADNKALIAFSNENATAIAASITDRAVWKTTVNFISLLFPGVGSVGPKAYDYLNGELYWVSKEGGRKFTQVGSAIQVSKNTVATHEMQRSFENLSPILSRSCCFAFDSYIGMSVPSGDIYNRHTWVLGTDIANFLTASSPPAWQGIWMGTRPVEWAHGTIYGKDRCFQLSQDRDGGVRIWEAFMPIQEDDGNQIFTSLEFVSHEFNEPLSFKGFKFTEYHLKDVSGEVNLTADYRGEYGCWKNILDIDLCALDCHPVTCPTPGARMPDKTPQNRYYKTQEAQHVCDSQEGPTSENIGTHFQNRIRWHGKAGVNKYRTQAIQKQESSTGACETGDTVNGVLSCKSLACCDEEVDYISIANDQPYGYGSANSSEASL